ncbi:MAG TPA: diacylglycerol kinase family protein [Candidatus Nanopelagicales bacterium]|nr:diacylglycerol kinase family protein [Candidatus Nanopelagicales bacterium]
MSSGGECVAVVHPQKSGGAEAASDQLARWAHALGQPTPHVVTTTADSPGTEQARAAVGAGADLVLAWGGDGTVNSVAAGLAGTGVPMGILPAGTGNLLARNLGLPLGLRDAASVALTGRDRTVDLIDVGLGGRVMTCAVMAGIGLDAVLIDAPEDLKNVIGPTAYVVNGIRALGHRTTRFGISVDGGPPHWLSAKSALVVNVGGLVAGLDIAPEAEVSDGLLHVVVLPLGTPLDWARTASDLALRRPRHDRSRRHFSGRSAVIVSRDRQPRQVDGDVVDDGTRIEARVRPGALVVRVPR